MDILDDMGESKLSAKVFLRVNYSFKEENNSRCISYSWRQAHYCGCLQRHQWFI